MLDKDIIRFIKKKQIIQEFVSRGRLPLCKVEDMLQEFKDEIIKKINKTSQKDGEKSKGYKKAKNAIKQLKRYSS